MLRISLLVLATTALWAQTAATKDPEPPPEVDKALRARINEFCELHRQGKFRQAEQMVAEDTKDYFYNAGKPRYVSYEIKSIKYNEDFTKALAMVICEHYLPVAGFAGKTVKLSTPFRWKIENGQWMWYMDMTSTLASPFGKATMAEAQARRSEAGASSNTSAAPPSGPPAFPASAEAFFAMVKPDRTDLDLKPGDSGQVVISNGTPGPVGMQIMQQFPGVVATLEKDVLAPGGKDVLTVQAGTKPASGIIRLQVRPVGSSIVIKVTVQ